MKNKCYYTSTVGGRDLPRKPLVIEDDWDYICFTDEPAENICEPWKVRPVTDLGCPNRTAKQYKVRPFLFLPEYEWTVWVDANFRIDSGFNPVIKLMTNEGLDLFMFPHQERSCIYEEAKVVKSLGLDDAAIVDDQVEFLKEEGFPGGYGLVECGNITRRRSYKVDAMLENWWSMISRYSKRDQLSFMYCVWKHSPRMGVSEISSRQSGTHTWTSHSR